MGEPSEVTTGVPKVGQISRRNVLKLGIGAGAGLFLGKKDSETRSEQLSFKEAQKLVESTVDLFIDAVSPTRSKDEILKRIFILKGNFKAANSNGELSVEEIKDLPEITNLLSDYSTARFTDEELKEISRKSAPLFGGSAGEGFVVNDKVFINIDSMNNTESVSEFMQYLGTKGKDGCKASTPTSHLRSILLHELCHQDAPFEHPVDERVAKAAFEFHQGGFIATGQDGFYVIGETPNGEKTSVAMFEEMIADYLASKISQKNDLYFMAGYSPIDTYNFSIMLNAANIKDTDLIKMHRGGNLYEFLLRLGKAAPGNHRTGITQADSQALRTSFLLASKIDYEFPPDWAFIKQFFPEVEVTGFKKGTKTIQTCSTGKSKKG